jgi:hypothetical protein
MMIERDRDYKWQCDTQRVFGKYILLLSLTFLSSSICIRRELPAISCFDSKLGLKNMPTNKASLRVGLVTGPEEKR